MAEENDITNVPEDDFRMSGAGRGAGTDPLTPQDLAPPPLPPLPPMSEGLRNYMSEIGMGQPVVTATNQSIKDLLNDVQVNGLPVADDAFKMGKQVLGDFNNPNISHQYIDRYQAHANWDKLGFTPFRDNETLYNENSSFLNEMGRASGEWATLAGLGFKSMLGAGDITQPGIAAEYEGAMAIGSSSKGGLGGFATNFYLNSGYTVGILAELAMEEVAMAAGEVALTFAEIPSFGAAAPLQGALALRMAARAKKAYSKIGAAFDAAANLTKTMKNIKDVNKARQFWAKTGRSVGRFINPLENTVGFFRNADKLKDLNGLQKTAKGFGAFYRDTRNVRAAWQEAGLEGGMVQNSMERDLLAEFQTEHGRVPSKKEAQEIRETAYMAGRTTSLINSPVIYFSNKLTFDGLMRGRFTRMNADVMKSIKGRKVLFDGRKGVKEAFKKLPKNYFKAKWEYIKNPKLILTQFGKYNKANLAEGLQEVAQETIAGASEEYYKGKYSGNGDILRGGYMTYLASNLGKQVSAQGFETFMSGYLMGGLVSPVSNIVAASTQGKAGFEGTLAGDIAGGINNQYSKRVKYRNKPGEYTKWKAEQDKAQGETEDQLNEEVNMLNEMYDQGKIMNYFSPELENLMEQKEYQKGMDIAEENGDKRTYYDMKDSSNIGHIQNAIKYGRLGSMIERLQDMKGLSAEELKDITGMSQEEFNKTIDKTINHAKNIEALHKMASEKYRNPFDPSKHKGIRRQEETIKMIAWDQAVQEMVFNSASFERSLERQKSILENAKEVAGLKNTPYRELNTLFNKRDILTEVELLKKELYGDKTKGTEGITADEAITPEMKKIIKDKEKKLKQLEAFDEAMDEVNNEFTEKGEITEKTYNKLKKAYSTYLKSIGEAHGDYINDEKVEESLQDIIDYYNLKERSYAANEAVNRLLDPEGFLDAFERIAEIREVLFANKKAEIEASLKVYKKAMKKNKMLSELYDAGMFFDVEDLVKLEEEGIVPNVFYYHAEGEAKPEVPMTNDDYKKAVGILGKYIDTLENIKIVEERFNPYSSKSRRKNSNDTRTYEELAKQFGFDPESEKSVVKLKKVLEAIIESEYSTERDIALAQKMLDLKPDENETVTFVNDGKIGAEFTETEQTVIDARYNANEYEQGRNGNPIEYSILHSEVQRRVMEALGNPEFKGQIETLLSEARVAFGNLDPVAQATLMENTPGPVLYGLSGLKEFIQESMSNETFQTFLAQVKTEVKTEKTNAWKKFVDLVLKKLKEAFGTTDGTVLNAALDVITANIDQTYIGGAPAVTTKIRKDTGIVERTMSVNELRTEHPELAKTILDLFKAENARRAEEDTDMLLEGIDEMKDDEIMRSGAFSSYLKSPAWRKKEAAITTYNKGLQRTAKKAGKKVKKKTKGTGKPQITKVPEVVNDEMRKELKEIGFTNREINKMGGGEATKHINEYRKTGLTKEERKAAEAVEKEDPVIEEKRKAMIKEVEDIMDGITNVEEHKEADARLRALFVSDPDYRRLAGFTGEQLDKMLLEKLNELALDVNFDTIQVDNVMVLNNKYESKVIVTGKTKDSITVQYMSKGKKVMTIKKDNIKDKIKYKWNEAWEDPNFKISETEPVSSEAEVLAEESTQNLEEINSADAIKEDIDVVKNKDSKERYGDLFDDLNCK